MDILRCSMDNRFNSDIMTTKKKSILLEGFEDKPYDVIFGIDVKRCTICGIKLTKGDDGSNCCSDCWLNA